jgi:hypothetical protein
VTDGYKNISTQHLKQFAADQTVCQQPRSYVLIQVQLGFLAVIDLIWGQFAIKYADYL